ncbi:hypothetical protein HUG12_05695 [Halorarum salinum]|uniref:Uncharacterized protein n=1 Tax=Halorarum salinum TaxID=2743089 RepID=A0A7D5L9J1_9EURY|nr:hypothetical protein HUG12_05695 [Halobaculum salinum]
MSRSVAELEKVTRALDEPGLTIDSSETLKRHRTRPFDQFGSNLIDD